jgi:hypothetical protein
MLAEEEGRQPERKAIEHGEIGRIPSGAIADWQLVFEQERLSYDPSHATRAEEFGEGNEQMDRQDQHIAQKRKITTSADLHNTEPGRDSCQKLRIRHLHARPRSTSARESSEQDGRGRMKNERPKPRGYRVNSTAD